MKKVLVTGASGQLGLAIKAAQKNYPKLSFVFVGKKELDVTSPGQIEAFLIQTPLMYASTLRPIPTWTKPRMSQKQRIY